MAKLCWVFILLFLSLGLVATVLGFEDAFDHGDLSAQVVGVSYLVSGLTATVGAVVMAVTHAHKRRAAAIVTGIATGYVAGTFALYAGSYRIGWCALFAALFILSGVLIALSARSRDLRHVGKVAGTLGISIALVFTGAQLWYASIYEPRNTDIALTVSVSAGPPDRISRKTVLVPLTLEIQNHSSLTALVLNSLFTATAVRYHASPEPAATVAANEIKVGLAQNTMPQSKNVNYSAAGDGVTRSLVAISRIVGDGSFVLPDATVQAPFDLEVPSGKFQELDVETDVDYARKARVALGPELGRLRTSAKNPRCVVGRWRVIQSHVISFLRGPETLNTDWCAEPHPFIETYFGGSPTLPFDSAIVSRNDADAAFIHASRIAMLPLHLPAASHVPHSAPPQHLKKMRRRRHCHPDEPRGER